jgi:hypothetical protein
VNFTRSSVSARWFSGFAAGLLLFLAGCASPSSSVQNSSPANISPTLALNYIQVVTTSSLKGLTVEQHSLSDAVISGLNDTALFQEVSADAPTNSPVNGIKLVAEIRQINKVSDDARTWVGTFAGQAQILVHVTITDLSSGAQVKTFDAMGKSGKSARAGTTDEAIEMAAGRIVAQIVRINSQTSD